MTKQVFWLFVVLLSLGQLQRIELSVRATTVAFYAHDLCIVGWLLWRAADVRDEVSTLVRRWRAAPKWLLALLGWIGFGVASNLLLSTSLVSALYLARVIVYVCFAFMMSKEFVKPIEKVDLRERYIISGLVLAITGLAQYLVLPDTRFLGMLGWDTHYYRLLSTLLDPAFTGICLVLTWIYVQSISWIHRHPLLLAGINVLLASALALTYSRASYLAFLLSLALAGLLHWQRKRPVGTMLRNLGLSLVVAVMVLVMAPKPAGEGVNLARTSTIESRINTTSSIFDTMSVKTLVIGDGLFAPRQTKEQANHARLPDNVFVLLLQGLGVPGFVLALVALYHGAHYLWHADRWMLVALLAVLTHGQFNNTLFEPFTLLFLLGGLSSISPRNRDYPFTA